METASDSLLSFEHGTNDEKCACKEYIRLCGRPCPWQVVDTAWSAAAAMGCDDGSAVGQPLCRCVLTRARAGLMCANVALIKINQT